VPDRQNGDMRQKRYNVNASCGISSPLQAVNSMSKRSFRRRFMWNIFYFHINPFFLVFKQDFIRCVDFTRISASDTASDDVTNYVTHRIFNTDLSVLLHSFSHFV